MKPDAPCSRNPVLRLYLGSYTLVADTSKPRYYLVVEEWIRAISEERTVDKKYATTVSVTTRRSKGGTVDISCVSPLSRLCNVAEKRGVPKNNICVNGKHASPACITAARTSIVIMASVSALYKIRADVAFRQG